MKYMNVVGYVRISRDEDRANYSSILTQQDIIREYAEDNNWTINKIYIDDNVSGYTFNRPEFSIMLNELNNGNIDIIIAKDFSRIGRNQGEAMVFIDSIKRKGKRLILISDSYDSIKEDDIIGIKAWYNEMYLKDISRKIRESMHSKQKKGELIMGNHYGYVKVKVNNKFQLVVDEDIRSVIQLIYKSYIDGLGYKKICNLLNEKKYPTPSEYLKRKQEEKGSLFKNAVAGSWQIHMVKRIIQDNIYMGTLTTKKSKSQVGVIKGNQIKTKENEQYVFENHHEAIISKEDFNLAHTINERRKKNCINGKAKYSYIFRGFMKCGDCGAAVIGKNIKKSTKIERWYNCSNYQKYGNSECSNHSVPEMKILFFFKEFLKDVRDEYLFYINNVDFKASGNDIVSDLNKLQKELDMANKELKFLISQKIKDIIRSNDEYKSIIEESYFQLEEEKKKKISELEQRISEFIKIDSNYMNNNHKSAIYIIDNIIKSEVPERKILEETLDKIVINKDKSIEFKLMVNTNKLANKNE